MKLARPGVSLLAVALIFLLGAAVATATDIPLKNWAAPSTWTPTAPAATKSGVKAALVTTLYAPLPFVPLTPCRVVDTRLGSGFPPGYGPPALAALATRSFTIGGQCGIPTTAQAVSFQFTAVNMTANGNFRAWPGGTSMPTASVLNWTATSGVAGNGIVVPVGGVPGVLDIYLNGPVSSTVDLVLDVNGYYAPDVSASNGQMFQISSSGPYAIWGSAALAGVVGTGALYGVAGLASGSAGVFGAGEGTAAGVWGTSSAGNGVYGDTTGGGIAGILGTNNVSSDGSHGVGGFAGGGAKVYGVQGQIGDTATADSAGVHGIAPDGGPGRVYGVIGDTASTWVDAAGVLGRTDTALNNSDSFYAIAGVRGESGGTFFRVGVLGVANLIGVFGAHHNGSGVGDAQGYLGYNPGTAYGVYANVGTIGCNGCTKQFVDPHPTDPSKTIHYVSLEGPEAGTYFRGTARTHDGHAVIEVPDHFRFVTDEEGMTVQLTAVGAPASLYVESQDLNQIVVRSSRDVTFHYLVQGIRPAHKNFQPIVEGREYAPMEPDTKMLPGWTEWTKRRLVQNGTYNPDGTVNMKTAERLGWTQGWREAENLRPKGAAKTSKPEFSPGPDEK